MLHEFIINFILILVLLKNNAIKNKKNDWRTDSWFHAKYLQTQQIKNKYRPTLLAITVKHESLSIASESSESERAKKNWWQITVISNIAHEQEL